MHKLRQFYMSVLDSSWMVGAIGSDSSTILWVSIRFSSGLGIGDWRRRRWCDYSKNKFYSRQYILSLIAVFIFINLTQINLVLVTIMITSKHKHKIITMPSNYYHYHQQSVTTMRPATSRRFELCHAPRSNFEWIIATQLSQIIT